MNFTITFDLSSEPNNLTDLFTFLITIPYFHIPTQLQINTSFNSNYTITLIRLTSEQLTLFTNNYINN